MLTSREGILLKHIAVQPITCGGVGPRPFDEPLYTSEAQRGYVITYIDLCYGFVV